MNPVIAAMLILIAAGLLALGKKKEMKNADVMDGDPIWSQGDWQERGSQRKSSSYNMPDWKRKEIWEDYPAPDYEAYHTYCRVQFDESGETYYYRTRNPQLKVGDAVYVPVGYQYEKKVGRIVSMRNVKGWAAPYPLEKTKHIIGKL